MKTKEMIEEALERLWPAESATPIHAACRYALIGNGKRLRPLLAIEVANAIGRGYTITHAALAVEYFHTASLVVDDLPCMDDDDKRRGKPSLHATYGKAVALLVSYALIADGYGLLAHDLPPITPQACALALENAAYNTGLDGATGGQFFDIHPPNLDVATQKAIIHKKTASLFEIAFVVGWLYGGGDPSALATIKACAAHYGLAFQIADDIADLEQDRANGRAINLAAAIGSNAAQRLFDSEASAYRDALASLNIATPALIDSLRNVLTV